MWEFLSLSWWWDVPRYENNCVARPPTCHSNSQCAMWMRYLTLSPPIRIAVYLRAMEEPQAIACSLARLACLRACVFWYLDCGAKSRWKGAGGFKVCKVRGGFRKRSAGRGWGLEGGARGGAARGGAGARRASRGACWVAMRVSASIPLDSLALMTAGDPHGA